jgi:hypothetical protein
MDIRREHLWYLIYREDSPIMHYYWYRLRLRFYLRVIHLLGVKEGEAVPRGLRWFRYLVFPISSIALYHGCVFYDPHDDSFVFGGPTLKSAVGGRGGFRIDSKTCLSLIHLQNEAVVYAFHLVDQDILGIYEIPQCGQKCLRMHRLCRFTTIGEPDLYKD